MIGRARQTAWALRLTGAERDATPSTPHPTLRRKGGGFPGLLFSYSPLPACGGGLGWGVETPRPASQAPSLTRWLVIGVWAAMVAVGLAAVQLAPSLEATGLASRGVSGVPESPSFSVRALLQALGPSPIGLQPVESWEPGAGLGLAWIAVAGLAPIADPGPRPTSGASGPSGIALGLAAFALGGAGLVQGLPVFKMFRQPARMLLVAGPAGRLPRRARHPGPARRDRPGTPRRGPSLHGPRRGRVLVAWLAVAAVAAGRRQAPATSLLAEPLGHAPGRSSGSSGPTPLGSAGAGRSPGSACSWSTSSRRPSPHLQTRDLGDVLDPSAVARARRRPRRAARPRARPQHPRPPVEHPARPGRRHRARAPSGPRLQRARHRPLPRNSSPSSPTRSRIIIPTTAWPTPTSATSRCSTSWASASSSSRSTRLSARCRGEPDPDLDPSWRRVATDPAPSAFTFAAGGVRRLPALRGAGEPRRLPARLRRARGSSASPSDRAGVVRAMTTTDFRRVALVESPGPVEVGDGAGAFRPAGRLVPAEPRRGRGRRPRPARPRRPRLPRLVRHRSTAPPRRSSGPTTLSEASLSRRAVTPSPSTSGPAPTSSGG